MAASFSAALRSSGQLSRRTLPTALPAASTSEPSAARVSASKRPSACQSRARPRCSASAPKTAVLKPTSSPAVSASCKWLHKVLRMLASTRPRLRGEQLSWAVVQPGATSPRHGKHGSTHCILDHAGWAKPTHDFCWFPGNACLVGGLKPDHLAAACRRRQGSSPLFCCARAYQDRDRFSLPAGYLTRGRRARRRLHSHNRTD